MSALKPHKTTTKVMTGQLAIQPSGGGSVCTGGGALSSSTGQKSQFPD